MTGLRAVVTVGAVLVWTNFIPAQPSDTATGQSIEVLLAAKARRTPVHCKLSSQLPDAVQPLVNVTSRRAPASGPVTQTRSESGFSLRREDDTAL